MKKILIIGCIIFSSCNGQNKKVNEDLKKIADFYGSTCKLNYEASISNKEGTNKFYILEMRDGDYLKRFKNNLSIPTSNAAVMLYKEFLKNTKAKKLKVEVYFDNKSVYENEFSFFELEKLSSRESYFKNIYSKILNSQEEEIFQFFDEEVKETIDINSLINAFKNVDSLYGKPREITTQGFTYGDLDYKGKKVNLVNYLSTVKRDSTNTKLSIYLDEKTNKIFSIAFDW